MNCLSVVIPSRNIENLIPCVCQLQRMEPELRVIVVDDGLDKRLLPELLESVEIIGGVRPFVFAGNCNLGIKAAGQDDVILLNDDALLKTKGGFTAMQAAVYLENETRGKPFTYGLVSAACNYVGNPNQWKGGNTIMAFYQGPLDAIRPEPRMVCFVSVLIPRSTLDLVGLLDENFIDYGCDDDDFCLRVRRAGLKIGIFDGCEVDHGSLPSTFRPGNVGGSFHANLERFKQKWGAGNMDL